LILLALPVLAGAVIFIVTRSHGEPAADTLAR
jgi:hypothetical protein